MNEERILSNAHLVLRDEVASGTVQMRDGVIAGIATGPTAAPGAVDLEGDYLIPGLIELHTDHLEAHAFPRPGVRWPMMQALLAFDAAIAGAGITTVCDAVALGHDLGKDYQHELCGAMVEALDAADDDGLLRAEHLLHLRCEITAPGVGEEFDRRVDHPRVRLVSVMDHTPGQRQFVDTDKYREYHMGKYGINADVMEAQIARRAAEQERYARPHRAHVSTACRARGIRLASHDDGTAAHVAEAVADGATIAEFPTTRAAADAARAHGLATVVGAPNLVRGGSHSGNVAAAELADAGLLDVLSSDYVPSSLLDAAWRLHGRGYELPAALATVTTTPARLLGLTDRGEIAPGRRADLVRVRAATHGPVVRRVWRAGRVVA